MSTTKLKAMRKKELQNAAKILHIEDMRILRLPDAGVKKYSQQIFQKGLAYAKKIQPEVVLSFGPHGISGHYDHITVGVQAKKIAKKVGARFYAVILPPNVAKNALAYFRTRRSAGHYASDISFQKLSIRVSIDPKVEKRAIRAHLLAFLISQCVNYLKLNILLDSMFILKEV